MSKYTMTRTAARRIASALTKEEFFFLTFDDWKQALANEGYRGYTTSNIMQVIQTLQEEDPLDTHRILLLAVGTLQSAMLEVVRHREQWENLGQVLGHMNHLEKKFVEQSKS